MKHTTNPEHIQTIKKWLGTGSINLFGPQFAGKDTQGNMLVELFDAAPLLGGGDILRNSVIPEHTKKIMERGELFPTQDYIDIVLPYLSRPEFNDKPLILSAIGRWHGEEKGVLEVTTKSRHHLKAVIYLTLDTAIVWQRWQRYRDIGDREMRRDDSKQGLEMRLKEFNEKTLPVINFYRNAGILIEIDGNQPQEKVFNDIISSLLAFAQK